MQPLSRTAFIVTAMMSLAVTPAASSAQVHQTVYSYAAVLDSAGNHYVPMNTESYPQMPSPGYKYFMEVQFRFTNKSTGAPVVLTANANRPGVSFAGYHAVSGQSNEIPSAWLIKAELVPLTGAPRELTPATLGDKYYIGYDTAVYAFTEIL